MLIDMAGDSHIGRKKDKNEDSYGIFGEDTPELALFRQGALLTVADGLGGHIGGDIASKLTVSMLRDVVKESPPPEEIADSEREDDYYVAVLQKALVRANESIYRTNRDLVKNGRPMGTTATAALVRPKTAYVVNVGDSRAYLFRNGSFIAQTRDHSWVDEQVSQGLMTKSEAEKDKRKNLLTRSIGTHPEIESDVYNWRLEGGDQLLLCSDGLINMVQDNQMRDILAQPALAAEKVDALIALANEQGGKDNITAIVAVINPDKGQLKRLKRQAWLSKHKAAIKRGMLIALFGLACYVFGCVSGYLIAR